MTDDIEEARTAYAALEQRTAAAEARIEQLQTSLSALRAGSGVVGVSVLRQRVADLEAAQVQVSVRADQVTSLKFDVNLQNLVSAVGLALAVGEASMPGRTISSASATVTGFMVPDSAGSFGLRLFQPELAPPKPLLFGLLADVAETQAAAAISPSASTTMIPAPPPSGVSSASFELLKVPESAGAATPPAFYTVLETKQQLYSSPPFQGESAAAAIVATATATLAGTGGWTFASLLQATAQIADHEVTLAGQPPVGAPGDAIGRYLQCAQTLQSLVAALQSKPMPVAGDLRALTAALAASSLAALQLSGSLARASR